jgi:hypothetical protein
MHLHYLLFAEILRDLAKTAAAFPPDDDLIHREALRDSAKVLYLALETNPADLNKTPVGAA